MEGVGLQKNRTIQDQPQADMFLSQGNLRAICSGYRR
jgi:hypothetical protein